MAGPSRVYPVGPSLCAVPQRRFERIEVSLPTSVLLGQDPLAVLLAGIGVRLKVGDGHDPVLAAAGQGLEPLGLRGERLGALPERGAAASAV
ncbi:hypothetical protein GCM10029992_28640 [Glycomyces albus]